LLTIPVLGLTAADRPAAANDELLGVRAILQERGGRDLEVSLILAELYALLRQGHLDEHFDAVAERFFACTLPRAGMLRQHQSFYLLHAQARLAQCRAAGETSGSARWQAARAAVRQLGSVAGSPLLAAGHRQCRAELFLLQGRPRRALRQLARLRAPLEDAPLLRFEIARTSARALLATGHPEQARHEAGNALHLAQEHGWTGRRRQLVAEFGPGEPGEPGPRRG
jgi:hypothetical protein